jgi:hypothetical protein
VPGGQAHGFSLILSCVLFPLRKDVAPLSVLCLECSCPILILTSNFVYLIPTISLHLS